MPDLQANIGNFVGCGQEFTRYGNHVVRNVLRVSCGGFRINLMQRDDIVTRKTSDFVGRFIQSTDAQIENIDERQVNDALKVIDRICWLLSFASQSRVVRYGYSYPSGSINRCTRAVTGEANFFRPAIDIIDGTKTIGFLERCFDTYARIENQRKLPVVIDYLVRAEQRSQPTEIKLLIAFTVLENLKSTYARSAGIPYKKGFFRKIPKPKGSSDKYGFEELLQLMFKDVGMRKGLKRIIGLRNEIIHSGLSQKSYSWQWAKYEHLQYLIREYTLRLLGYHGEYLTYRGRGNERKAL